MGVKVKRIIFTWLVCVTLILSTAVVGHAYSSILAFGDSISDNGQYGMYGDALAYTNPDDVYGILRCSNGPTWVEYLARGLGVPLVDMAYSGATSGMDNPDVSKIIGGYAGNLSFDDKTGLKWQVNAYGAYNGYSPSSISADTLITVLIGHNDMVNYFTPLTAQAAINKGLGLYDPSTAASNVTLAIQNAILLGGRSFLVLNLSNSQQPAQYVEWRTDFNGALSSGLSALRSDPLYSDVNFSLLDMNAFTPTGIDHFDGAWLGHNDPSHPMCVGAATCFDMGEGTYAWWDKVGVHPSTEVHQQMAAYAAAHIPEPATMLLLGLGLIGLAGVRRKFKK